jgi:hypothetical protein
MKFRRVLAGALLAGFLPAAVSGCFGRFELTRKVYRFNKEISPDKWIQWMAFLVLTIVPVYGIATFVDAVVANSLEFWTGRNPVVARVGDQRVTRGPAGEFAVSTLRGDGSIDLEIQDASGRECFVNLAREGSTLLARDAEGRVLRRVVEVDGKPMLVTKVAR